MYAFMCACIHKTALRGTESVNSNCTAETYSGILGGKEIYMQRINILSELLSYPYMALKNKSKCTFKEQKNYTENFLVSNHTFPSLFLGVEHY